MKIRRYTVDICDDCLGLVGSMCHTPGCVLIRKTTEEIREFLSISLIRFEINGEVFRLQKTAPVVEETE